MYETYVPIAETIVERKPPTIADIVREKTDDGARIVDFFLDLMEGRVDDARLCHRIDAAKQLVKYGYKKAADFIAAHRDEPCDHCESRRRGPRPRKDESPAAGPPYAAPHLTPDFLTLLTEDFFDVLTAVDEDLMIKLVRAQTRDADTIVEFLDDVMHNRVDGFKPNHRIAAARELISHIIRDEHRSHTSAIPAHKIVVPAKAETQRGGEERLEPPDEPIPSIVEEPVLSPVEGPKIVRPELVEGQCSGDSTVPGSEPNTSNLESLPRRRTRTQRRREGNTRAAIRGKARALLHDSDPCGAPIDSRSPGRSPPGDHDHNTTE